jgi:nitroreductase
MIKNLKAMDIIDLILTRRSVRKYTGENVSNELVEKLLKAGMYAPSAGNQQAWHFVVLREKQDFEAITQFHEFSRMLPSASVAIVVCADLKLETKLGYWMVDCSAATENILLAAHGLGLGAVWLGIYPRTDRMEALSEMLNLPENVKPFSLISIGYPAEEKKVPERFNPERIHHNRW